MQIKINNKIFSVSPYLSTSWSCIATLHLKGGMLAVTLTSGDTVNIPNLDKETLNTVFAHHAAYLETQAKEPLSSISKEPLSISDEEILKEVMKYPQTAFSFSINPSEGLGTALQHNPEQANAPGLPPEILEKIAAITKIFSDDDVHLLPLPEPGCNCMHCQIVRAMNPNAKEESPHARVEDSLEGVPDEELQFQQWHIEQTAEHLFSVTNKLDRHEKYNVYLGHPVGCTCGKEGCEHILAVLKS